MVTIATPQQTLGPTGAAISFVNQGWNFFENKANTFVSRSLSLVERLADATVNVEPIGFSVEFPPISGLEAFNLPTVPTLPTIEFRPVDIPQAPVPDTGPPPTFAEAPIFDVPAPVFITLPDQPGNLSATAPGAPPELTQIVLPTTPDIVLPALPTLFALQLPELPNVVFPEFAGTDPGDVPGLPLLADVQFVEQPYTRAVLDQVITRVQTMLQGGTGLPAAIEEALFARGRERIDRAGVVARQQVAEDVASRGFGEPDGVLAARLAEAAQNSQNQINEHNRDITIQVHNVEVENLRFAVTQGIALEQILIAQHAQTMDRALNAVRLVLDTRIGLFNAQITAFNAKVSRFQADAQVFRDRIQAKVAEIDAFRAQIEGQKAVADVNKTLSDIYESQIRGVLAAIEVFKAQVDAAEVQARVDQTRIEGYRARVQAFEGEVRAFAEQWNGFRAAADAQISQTRVFEIGVNAFAARSRAWADGEQNKNARYENQIRAANLTLDGYRNRILAVNASLQAESTRITALAQQGDQVSRLFSAQGQVELSRTEANNRAVAIAADDANNRATVKLREAEIKIEDARRSLTLQLEGLRGAAAALAQLAASAMSAVNFSAGVSGSGSESLGFSNNLGKSKSWNYSGETPDADAPFF